jgi:hypothetical protein
VSLVVEGGRTRDEGGGAVRCMCLHGGGRGVRGVRYRACVTRRLRASRLLGLVWFGAVDFFGALPLASSGLFVFDRTGHA